MSPQRPRRFAAASKQRPPATAVLGRSFPIEREIQRLEGDLCTFNERIAELETEGHRGRAMEVLKANAIDMGQKIDELRVLLAEPGNEKG